MPALKKIILVLGHRNDAQGIISSLARERLDQGIKEYYRHPGSKLMVTGAFGLNFNVTALPHAWYLEKYLQQHGIPAADLLPYIPSRNTAEDARLARQAVYTYGNPELVIVTSDFHLPRVRYLFEKLFPKSRLQFVGSVTVLPAEEFSPLVEHEQKALRLLKAGKL